MVEKNRTHRNSWGSCRIIQEHQIDLEIDVESNPPRISNFSIDERALRDLDESAKVRLYINRKLRRQSFDCGKVGRILSSPKDLISGDSALRTVGIGRYQWVVRISDQSGYVICQNKRSLYGSEPFIGTGENAILRISQGEVSNNKVWEIDFTEGNDLPVVVVDNSCESQFSSFMKREQELWHCFPQMVSSIIDELIELHCDGLGIGSHPEGTWQNSWVDSLSNRFDSPLPVESEYNSPTDALPLMGWKKKCIDKICNDVDIREKLENSEVQE